MSAPIDSIPETNFAISNLPPNTAAFYNSEDFAKNEMKQMCVTFNMMQKEFEQGQQDLAQVYQEDQDAPQQVTL